MTHTKHWRKAVVQYRVQFPAHFPGTFPATSRHVKEIVQEFVPYTVRKDRELHYINFRPVKRASISHETRPLTKLAHLY